MVQNRGILITLRAAAIVIIATGLNDVLASALPGYEPLYLYLGAIALVGLLDGIVLAILTALLCVGFYELLFTPRAEVLTARMVLPAGAAFATAIVAATIRGLVRVARRRPVEPVYVASPPLLETSSVARVADNVEVLAAIDELRSELRNAVAELGSTRNRADELEDLRRSQNAEREAVEARARQLERDRDWALKTSQVDRESLERERAMRADAERQLAVAREESATMAGRVAELELAGHERDRERAETSELRRALELERRRADGEKSLREELAADGTSLRTRIAELEEALAGAAPASEFDELRRALGETRNARDRARAETMAEKTRADGLERAVAAARAEADDRVGEERKRADVALARMAELEQRVADGARYLDAAAKRARDLEAAAAEEHAVRERLDAQIAQFDAKLETISSRLAAEHETELAEVRRERDAARADAQSLRIRVAELEASAAAFDEKLQSIATHLASDHESDLGKAITDREEAKAEARGLRTRVTELEVALADREALLAEERERSQGLEYEAAEFDKRLQTIVTHLASDHETDLGQAMSEKEQARAEARALSMKLAQVQRKLEDAEALVAETRTAAQAEIDRLRAQLAAQAPAVASSRPRVLVVHPDADVRGAAAASLERAGYEVVGAADGLEALRVAIATRPEVVVAESSMPKMDGRELCQLLKSQEKTAGIRFVLLMRAGDDPPRGDFTPDEVLRKPVPVETLRATLAGLLSGVRRA